MKFLPQRAFTLVELLAVIAIIGVLAAIIIPVTVRVRESSRNAQCMANLRGLQNVAVLWSSDNAGRLPDARRWGYNEGQSNDSYAYQFANYIGIKAPKGTVWGDRSSPMKCDSAASLNLSSMEWGRTYSINTYATSTFDGDARLASNGYPGRMSWIPNPAKMAFFMDGAVAPAGVSYQTNVSGAYVVASHSTPLNYPHGDAVNVVFVDGHVERIDRTVMVSEHLSSNSSFWRFDR